MLKKALISVGVIVLAAILFSGWYGYKFYTETSKMNPNATKELVPGIFAINDGTFANMYLIKSGDSYVAIDAAAKLKGVEQEIRKLDISPDKVAAILLTHTDSDHTAALKLFKNAKVYISTEEEQMINGKTVRASFFMRNKLDSPYEMIGDNQTIDIAGLKVKGILTPGHTMGSMSYIINNDSLFTGDTLSLKDKKAELFNAFFNMDSELEAESIKKLATLGNIKYVFTAHYGYSDNYQQTMSAWNQETAK